MSYKIFFSHSYQDKNWVEWIAQNLQGLGIEVYMFEYDVQPGRYIPDKLKEAIDDSDAFLVLVTTSSQASGFVNQEIGYAEKAEKLIVPLVEKGVDLHKLGMLEGREYVPFDRWNPDQTYLTLANFFSKKKNQKQYGEWAVSALIGALLIAMLRGK